MNTPSSKTLLAWLTALAILSGAPAATAGEPDRTAPAKAKHKAKHKHHKATVKHTAVKPSKPAETAKRTAGGTAVAAVPAAVPAQSATATPVPAVAAAAGSTAVPATPAPAKAVTLATADTARPAGNPYLTARPGPANPYLVNSATVAGNPYLAVQLAPDAAAGSPAAPAAASPRSVVSSYAGGIKDLLPSLPGEGQSILPTVKKVYPTGEKPLVVITFKCPTELIGVTPLPTKGLHELVNLAMDGLNATNLLSFNLQQVCQ